MRKNNLFDASGPIFMGAKRSIEKCSIGIFGVEYDRTTSYRPGARFGPSSIRNVSECLESYCPSIDKDLEEIEYCDLGKLMLDSYESLPVINKVYKATRYLLDKNIKPIILGGEHSITTGVVKSLTEKYPDLILVQLDAHADLRESYLGNKNNHACTMRRCLELLPSKNIIQVGIRSGTKNEFDEMKINNQLLQFNIGDNYHELHKKLKPYLSSPIYITIDLDWFDPSLLPGTGTPEPGGFFWNDFQTIIDGLGEMNIVGGDIVELAPELDPSGVSSVVAAKVARSLIMTLDNIPRKELNLNDNE